MKFIIPIQSFSNIITNSSSELFCIISGNEDVLEFIRNLLSNLMDTEGYDEDYPSFEVFKKEDLCKDDFNRETWKNMPEIGIKISLPYHLRQNPSALTAYHQDGSDKHYHQKE